FAHLNREEMMDRMLRELSHHVYGQASHDRELEVERINCHHNFTQIEHHFGHDVWVTRKGAIEAREGMRGMIPGSMGTRSYIVTGLGNAQSFQSAPHGAGRRMSRTKARAAALSSRRAVFRRPQRTPRLYKHRKGRPSSVRTKRSASAA